MTKHTSAYSIIRYVQNRLYFKNLVHAVYGREIEKHTNFLAWINPEMVCEYITNHPFDRNALRERFQQHCLQQKKYPTRSQQTPPPFTFLHTHTLEDYFNTSLLADTHALPSNPSFSVIIPTLNGEKNILNVLEDIQKQKDIDNIEGEIIVIDDGSTDATRARIHEYVKESHRFPITYIRLKKNEGPSVARNIGVLHAHHSLLCFTDDDCLLPEKWISGFVRAFKENPEIAGAGGWYYTYENNNESLFDKYLYWYALPDILKRHKSATWRHNLCGNTANLCLRREAVLSVGGFNPLYLYPGFDDWELKIRLHVHHFSLLYQTHMVRHVKRHRLKSFIRMYALRGWGRFLIYGLHGIEPRYYNVSFCNSLRSLFHLWKQIVKDPTHLNRREKIVFFALATLAQGASWVGKYWIPLEISKRLSTHK